MHIDCPECGKKNDLTNSDLSTYSSLNTAYKCKIEDCNHVFSIGWNPVAEIRDVSEDFETIDEELIKSKTIGENNPDLVMDEIISHTFSDKNLHCSHNIDDELILQLSVETRKRGGSYDDKPFALNKKDAIVIATSFQLTKDDLEIEPILELTLDERMVLAGMIPVSSMLKNNILGKFNIHNGVTDLKTFEEWLVMRREEFIRMQAEMTLDELESNELFEWTVAHNSVFGEVLENFKHSIKKY
jgi:hypothetical protein